ncbi:mediator of rna polymerase ii transcription subunit 19 [Ophiostoma piceae UAMH 11346]|uniref:Mediator of RNA polymerase II transcription subunit 19 n=1 Tax=Ophiostoma piceae (strain UAMH 11346) TaxID=1262450 RepID=S3C010_OPHP1|nr:mediator of rna polymerase ii transcription subunit 19 [Ophiostoma piceae UAMH 11346]
MSFHPQTPQSPSQSSPISSVGNSSNINNNGGGLSSSFASSTSAAHSIQLTQSNQATQGSQTTQSTLPTPAHSVNGSGFGSGSGALDSSADMSALLNDDSPHKRKRLLDDAGEHELKKVHMEGQQRLDFEALHQDVGEKYLVCKNSHQPSFPPLSEDLYSMFNLSGIAAEVARTLPNGEKNAMRKTYKGYMKKLGVSGHFEPIKREPGDESDFMALLAEPEDSWQARQVKTKDIRYGLLGDVEASLRAALTMNKGPLPKAVWDNSVLGSDVPPLGSGVGGVIRGSSAARGTAPNTPLHPAALARSKAQSQPAVGSPGGATGAGATDSSRPRRMNKKRSYNDNSFEGYNETFDEDGYSTGGDNGDGPSHKRRKKNDTPTTQYPPAPVRQQSYGPGMVGA